MRTMRRRKAQSGQFIVVYIMGIFTMIALALATLTIGQIMVRRQWAQVIADAGAYAGAAREAEALNTMAAITKFNLELIDAIEFKDRKVPGYYTSSYSDCFQCYFSPSDCADDIKDLHEAVDMLVYNPINPLSSNFYFAALNGDMIQYYMNQGTSTVYSGNSAREQAYEDAKRVTEANLRQFFGNEYNNNTSRFKLPDKGGYRARLAEMAGGDALGINQDDEWFDDSVAWRYYTLDTSLYGIPAAICSGLSFWSCDVDGIGGPNGKGDHDEQPEEEGDSPYSHYHFEKVLKVMDKDHETTFLWWVQLPSTPPILGIDNILGGQGTNRRRRGNVPPITAVARAKPWDGHLGRGDGNNSENEEWPKRDGTSGLIWWVDWDWGSNREPKATYKVKFTSVHPLRLREDDPTIAIPTVSPTIAKQIRDAHAEARQYLRTGDIKQELEHIWH